ncbi:MAG: hypothetical protein JWO05_2499 [Gemmatimonadetes bacterium]|nr:hypothetical protein [Gemmatimonadota bacterium]
MGEIQFEEGGRTFTCHVAPCVATPDTSWWWVSVAGDGQRYAAFHANPKESKTAVKKRVVAYYEQVLADRARPPVPRAEFVANRMAATARKNAAAAAKAAVVE